MPPDNPRLLSPALIAGTIGIVAILAAMAWPGGMNATHLAAMLIFLVGLAFAAFLWWLAARSFAMLNNPATTAEQIAAMRELPMALPEGTVRAVLALIVGVVGLPLLLFAATLGLSDAIAGYVNGIIAGVFGYYFGARTQTPDAQAQRRVSEALTTEQRAHAETRATAAANTENAVAAALRPVHESDATGKLNRHLAVAELVVEGLGSALPGGIIPQGATNLLRQARQALSGGDISAITAATTALTGASGPLASLISAAAPVLGGVAGGPLAGAALVLGLGWNLSASGWRRWQAQVLDAPHDPTLFDPGSITPADALASLAAVPDMAQALADKRNSAGFAAELTDMALRDDGAARLWSAWGAGRFASPAAVEDAMTRFRRALLGTEARQDVTDAAVTDVAARLATASPALRPDAPDPEAVRRLLAPTSANAPEAARAAMEALTLLTGTLRDTHQDPVQLLQEITP
ncbi:hypothetical protein EOD42_05610 [Rhodovarius crocodyli]|uniref:Uncharacterized protein n=2 Tax=Rhodovarius crocodyli TaxID=1979269 RepID=A0A437MPJ4_9PROT|nr:hypothetical protein EOD42_05610 [Rhodovarius crocodyli]